MDFFDRPPLHKGNIFIEHNPSHSFSLSLLSFSRSSQGLKLHEFMSFGYKYPVKRAVTSSAISYELDELDVHDKSELRTLMHGLYPIL